MTLNLHLHIIYLLRQAEAARKEAERKALEESMAARKEEAERQTIEYTYEKRDSSYEGENVEQPKTTVTVLTQKDLARLKTLEEADTAYHKYALELKRMDQDMVPMTKDEFMKQNYPSLFSQTHQPAQAPHSIADFTKEQAKERLSQGQGSMPDAQWRQLVLRAQGHMPDMTDKLHSIKNEIHEKTGWLLEKLTPAENANTIGEGAATEIQHSGMNIPKAVELGLHVFQKLNLIKPIVEAIHTVTGDHVTRTDYVQKVAYLMGTGLGGFVGGFVGTSAGGLVGGTAGAAVLGAAGGGFGNLIGTGINKVWDYVEGSKPETPNVNPPKDDKDKLGILP